MSQSSDQNRLDWRRWRADWPIWVIIGLVLVGSALIYPALPERVPSHWNLRGEVDGTLAKPWGAFLLPAVTAAVYLLLSVVPLIDPKAVRDPQFIRSYRLIKGAVVLFLAGLHGMILAAAVEQPVPIERTMPLGIGLLILVLGGILRRVRPNYFVGVRTPWTLADDAVWQKTHAFSAKLASLGGLIIMAGAFLPAAAAMGLIFIVVVGIAIASTLYSYLAWRRRVRT
ncbi:MAG TPA: SdpI family protein [Limnochordia bacterium]